MDKVNHTGRRMQTETTTTTAGSTRRVFRRARKAAEADGGAIDPDRRAPRTNVVPQAAPQGSGSAAAAMAAHLREHNDGRLREKYLANRAAASPPGPTLYDASPSGGESYEEMIRKREELVLQTRQAQQQPQPQPLWPAAAAGTGESVEAMIRQREAWANRYAPSQTAAPTGPDGPWAVDCENYGTPMQTDSVPAPACAPRFVPMSLAMPAGFNAITNRTVVCEQPKASPEEDDMD